MKEVSLIYDFEKELSKHGLTCDTYEALLKDCSDKVQKITDVEWSELISKYDLSVHYDTLRKSSQFITGGAFVSEYYRWKSSHSNNFDNDEYMKKLQEKEDTIYKETRKLYDQRRERNKGLWNDARSEHLHEEIIKAANKLNDENPLVFNETYFNENIHKQGLLCWADWHYGMTTDNIWNKYNTSICRKRVKAMVEMTKEFIKINGIDTLNILMLGDAANGAIHVGCRVASEEETCDQLMHVAEIMAEAISDLSSVVNVVNVYSCYGNHMRTIQDKKQSSHSDNMEKVIPWWLKARLQNNDKVFVYTSEYKEFTRLNILGSNICAIHGDLERNFKDIGTTVNTIFTKKFGESIDYTISADKHHLEEFSRLGIDSILSPCLCGTDDYANRGRLYSDAGQLFMIFNDMYGRECTYTIPLNQIQE